MYLNLWKLNDALLFFLFFSSLFLTRAFSQFKLPLLIICFTLSILFLINSKVKLSLRPLLLIFATMLGVLIWSFVGVIHGNNELAIIESLRLFFAYYIINLVFVLYLFKRIRFVYVDILFSLATICIFTTAVLAIYNISLFPQWFIEEMNLRIGVYDGYIQNTAHHIGMLSLTVPYLMVVSVYNVSSVYKLVWFALMLGIITIILSSRRAVYLAIVLIPLTLLFVHYLSHKRMAEKIANLYSLFFAYFVLFSLSILIFYTYYTDYFLVFFDRILEAIQQVSEKNYVSERALQSVSLLKGFSEYPLLGSGFGGTVDVVRNSDRPWIFELSYHNLLFNIGIVGFFLFVVLNGYTLKILTSKLRKNENKDKYHMIAIIVSVVSMYVISYSNPYISSSYDFLFVNFLMPLLYLKGSVDSEKY